MNKDTCISLVQCLYKSIRFIADHVISAMYQQQQQKLPCILYHILLFEQILFPFTAPLTDRSDGFTQLNPPQTSLTTTTWYTPRDISAE